MRAGLRVRGSRAIRKKISNFYPARAHLLPSIQSRTPMVPLDVEKQKRSSYQCRHERCVGRESHPAGATSDNLIGVDVQRSRAPQEELSCFGARGWCKGLHTIVFMRRCNSNIERRFLYALGLQLHDRSTCRVRPKRLRLRLTTRSMPDHESVI